jgi:pre-mRNA-processing factor 17
MSFALQKYTAGPASESAAPKTLIKGKVPTGYAEEIVISEQSFRAAQKGPAKIAGQKRKREGRGDSSQVHRENAYKGLWAKFKDLTLEDSGSEEEVTDYSDAEDGAAPTAPLASLVTDYATLKVGETTEFLRKEMYDYTGKTYIEALKDLGIKLMHILLLGRELVDRG